MKTWKDFHDSKTRYYHDVVVDEKTFNEIQLDAFKAGERFAAEIKGVDCTSIQGLDFQKGFRRGVDYYKQAILTDAENRTEIPK